MLHTCHPPRLGSPAAVAAPPATERLQIVSYFAYQVQYYITCCTAPNMCTQVYCESILALQAKAGGAAQLPLAIMTSGDTHARTQALLEAKAYFGMQPGQVTLLKQEKVLFCRFLKLSSWASIIPPFLSVGLLHACNWCPPVPEVLYSTAWVLCMGL